MEVDKLSLSLDDIIKLNRKKAKQDKVTTVGKFKTFRAKVGAKKVQGVSPLNRGNFNQTKKQNRAQQSVRSAKRTLANRAYQQNRQQYQFRQQTQQQARQQVQNRNRAGLQNVHIKQRRQANNNRVQAAAYTRQQQQNFKLRRNPQAQQQQNFNLRRNPQTQQQQQAKKKRKWGRVKTQDTTDGMVSVSFQNRPSNDTQVFIAGGNKKKQNVRLQNVVVKKQIVQQQQRTQQRNQQRIKAQKNKQRRQNRRPNAGQSGNVVYIQQPRQQNFKKRAPVKNYTQQTLNARFADNKPSNNARFAKRQQPKQQRNPDRQVFF